MSPCTSTDRIEAEDNSRHGNVGQGKAILEFHHLAYKEMILWRFVIVSRSKLLTQQSHHTHGIMISSFGQRKAILGERLTQGDRNHRHLCLTLAP